MRASSDRLLDDVLPRRHVGEQHARLVQAPPEVVWRALREVPMSDLRWTHGLMRVRTLDAETRVLASRPRAGSGLIRSELLHAVARRAERAGG